MRKTNSTWVVLKFGGTSVSSLSCWQTIKKIVEKRKKEGLKSLVVCSAMAGVSNSLEKLIEAATKGKHGELLNNIQNKHVQLAKDLKIDASVINPFIEQLSQVTKGISLVGEASPRVRAQIMAMGELMSTKLGAEYFNANKIATIWCDARDLLTSINDNTRSEKHYLSASCKYDADQGLKNKLNALKTGAIITQGFIARDLKGNTVLLGRGGSDTSASYLAAKLSADRCEIWTDVSGIFTANPRQVPTSRLIRSLSYDEAQEIVSLGAKVLHPRSIEPVRSQKIPLHIYALQYPDGDGTIISSNAKKTAAQVKAISMKQGITLISMDSLEMWQQAGFLADLFSCFKQHGVSIDLVSTSETNVTVTLDKTSNVINSETIDSLTKGLSKFCRASVVHNVAMVSLVGKNIRSILHHLTPALEIFEEQRIYLVSHAANDLNLTFVVDEEQAEKLVQELHAELFKYHKKDLLFGETWQELSNKTQITHKPWWHKKRLALLKLAKQKTPLYVYDEENIDLAISRLKSLTAIDRLFYAIKANSYPEILKKIHEGQIGFECVSRGEIEHVLKLFPRLERESILFTPNFVGPEEYEYALKLGVLVTLDNLYPLRHWPNIFRKKDIFVRLDPGEGFGHHRYVHTGGAKSKFGIAQTELDDLHKLTEQHDVKIIGLHAHVGSNIFAEDTWGNTAAFLVSVAKNFPAVKFVDAGGGLGVVERPGGAALNMSKVNDGLAQIKKAHPKYKLWLEPGRFLVAEAGALLARITQTKQKGEYYFIGVNAGMNTLIRPALYGAYHEIVNLSQLSEESSLTANIVGPICESGDILGLGRSLPPPKDGDIMLIGTTGAYGRSMSSNYNLRQPADEYFLKK